MEKRQAEKASLVQEERDFTEFWKARNDELAVSENIEKEEFKNK